LNSDSLKLLEHSGTVYACTGTALSCIYSIYAAKTEANIPIAPRRLKEGFREFLQFFYAHVGTKYLISDHYRFLASFTIYYSLNVL